MNNQTLYPRLRNTAFYLGLFATAALVFSGCTKKEEAPPPAVDQASQEPPPEPTHEVKAKWPKGKRLVYRTDATLSTESTPPGAQAPVKAESIIMQEAGITVLKDRDGGGSELEMEFLSYKMDIRQPGRPASVFDSKNDRKLDPKGPPASPYLRKLIGQKVKLLTDASGKVEKVEGAAEVLRKVSAGANAQTQVQLRVMLHEESFKQLDFIPLGVPDKPVKAGDKWTRPLDALMALGMLAVEAEYTFKGLEDRNKVKCAALEVAGPITVKNAGAVAIENGKLTGRSWIDMASGVVVESAQEREMDLNIQSAGNSITSQMKTKSVTKLVSTANAVATGGELKQAGEMGKPTEPTPKAAAPKTAEAKPMDKK